MVNVFQRHRSGTRARPVKEKFNGSERAWVLWPPPGTGGGQPHGLVGTHLNSFYEVWPPNSDSELVPA